MPQSGYSRGSHLFPPGYISRLPTCASEPTLGGYYGLFHGWYKPVIGRVPGMENQWVIACFGGHGLLGALGAGKAIAEAIAVGETPSILEPYDPSRFGARA